MAFYSKCFSSLGILLVLSSQFLNLVGSVQSEEQGSVLQSTPQVPTMYDQHYPIHPLELT
ncbi:hypothetical protein IHE45_14G109800 [Dioscorea alata]|uniref:Uncharacterized protein n=1 Tax=Dioscorea alata TaxID=55571 RepID=A0ACB7UU97_DIOAL|nr:hypothetical protein IHE45_14G109800 [Dioscorea alata]